MKYIMKSLTGLIVTIMLLCAILMACQKEDAATVRSGHPLASEESQSVSPTQPQKPTLEEIIIKGDYTDTGNPGDYGEEWVKMWLEYTYSDSGITDIETEYISSASFNELSDSFEIKPILYSVRFLSQKPVSGAQKQPDGINTLKVLVVTIAENGKTVLSGFLGPDELNEYNALPSIYDIVSNDFRYSPDLKPFPKTKLPKEISSIDMHLISGGCNASSHLTEILPGDIVAVVNQKAVNDQGPYTIGVSLFDLENGKSCGYVDVGEGYILGTECTEGKFIIKIEKDYSSDTEIEVFSIDAEGSMTKKKYQADKKSVLYSLDSSKYAYSSRGSLYITDVKDNKSKEKSHFPCSSVYIQVSIQVFCQYE